MNLRLQKPRWRIARNDEMSLDIFLNKQKASMLYAGFFVFNILLMISIGSVG